MGFLDTLLYPFKVAIAWLWIVSHDLFVFLGTSESTAWVCGILAITIIVRLIVLPLALRSARSARAMSALQPEMKKIQDKYKGRTDAESRKQMNMEMSDLYGEYGANPMASCWPMIIQLPVLWALYRVLYEAKPIADGTWVKSSLGPLTQSVAEQIEKSTFFGAHLSESMHTSDPHARMVAIVLVVLYVGLMFLSMGWLAPKNMATGNDQSARMMKIMGYTMPIMIAFVGINLQIGVLVYWMVAMLFSLLQQWGILYFMPTPNSPAHAKMLKRNQRKYDSYKETREKAYKDKLEDLGVADQQVSEAQIKLSRAKAKSEAAHDAAKEELGSQMVEAAQLRTDHHQDLRDRRVKLELEAAPKKARKPGKKTFMQKMMEAQTKAEERQAGIDPNMAAGKRDQSKQPRNMTKAERKAQKDRREERRQASTQSGLTPEELEKRRQERKKQVRENRKKKRK